MHKAINTLEPIVTDDLLAAAHAVIEHVRRNIPHPFLINAKLGEANTGPMSDTKMASAHGTPPSTTSSRWKRIVNAVTQADQQHGRPLGQIAQRANAVMANGAIINRHKRRPPLYSESTIKTFIKLGYAEPEHSPLIRAASYVITPPATPRRQALDFIINDIAAHMARSHEPQSPDEILQSLIHRQEALAKWPQLDLTLFIDRVSGIKPDQQGLFHPHQPWYRFISSSQLMIHTMLRILARDQKPRTTQYLTEEIERLVGNFLPPGYNTLTAIRTAISKSSTTSWQGLSTYGLKTWETALAPQNMARPRGRTGDLIYRFPDPTRPRLHRRRVESRAANLKSQNTHRSGSDQPRPSKTVRANERRARGRKSVPQWAQPQRHCLNGRPRRTTPPTKRRPTRIRAPVALPLRAGDQCPSDADARTRSTHRPTRRRLCARPAHGIHHRGGRRPPGQPRTSASGNSRRHL